MLDGIEVDGSGIEIVETVFDYRPGDVVPQFRVGPDRLGHVVLKAVDEEQVRADLAELPSRIKIHLKEA